MTTFDQRERGFEAKFAADQKAQFAVHARQTRLLGLWAARKMGLRGDGAETYAKALVRADVEKVGRDDVVSKVVADLSRCGIEVSPADVLEEMARLLGKK